MSRRSTFSSAIVKARKRDWIVATVSGLIAVGALVVGSNGKLEPTFLSPRVTSGIAALILVLFGVVATRRFSAVLGNQIRTRTIPAAGAAARLLATGVGYAFVFFATLGVLDVSVEHLLVGAGLAGVVLGIAAQQSLGNVFAGFVLLFARPFVVGEHIRIRSGALGGLFDGTVLAISLTYVTVRVEDGVLKVPNSVLLAAAVGPFPTAPSVVEPPVTGTATARVSRSETATADTAPLPADEQAGDPTESAGGPTNR